jgi:hypothetical protein
MNEKDLGQGFFFIFIEHNYKERNEVGFIFIVMLVILERCHQQ